MFTESDRQAIFVVTEQVIPSLGKPRDDGYEEPGEDVCDMVNAFPFSTDLRVYVTTCWINTSVLRCRTRYVAKARAKLVS